MSAIEQIIAGNSEEIQRTLSPAAAAEILQSLEKSYYPSHRDPLADPALQGDIMANLCRRQAAFERHLVPWVNNKKQLSNSVIVDIGCGTGSSTAAFARGGAKWVSGYEISHGSASVGKKRLEALRLDNANVSIVDPNHTLRQLNQDHPKGIDIIALIAVLEHMTEAERNVFLPGIWDMMRPGDVLVVAELPNRLTYNDSHTTRLPFFHLLTTEQKIRHVGRSDRKAFAKTVENLAAKREQLETALCRWGIGLSFHDFESGFGVDNLETIILADGYEPNPTAWWPPSLEERILMDYFINKPINKPIGFCRSVLNLFFVKPHPGEKSPLIRHDRATIEKYLSRASFPQGAIERFMSAGTLG